MIDALILSDQRVGALARIAAGHPVTLIPDRDGGVARVMLRLSRGSFILHAQHANAPHQII